MGYATRLTAHYKQMAALAPSEASKQRDKRNQAGYERKITSSEFRTTVSGTQKQKGSSKPPRPL